MRGLCAERKAPDIAALIRATLAEITHITRTSGAYKPGPEILGYSTAGKFSALSTSAPARFQSKLR